MSTREPKYFDDSYSMLVYLEDGVPVEYGCQGPPFSKREEPGLAAKIEKLTGKRVRFGTWVESSPWNPRDNESKVDLLPALPDGFHALPDRFGELVVIFEGRPFKFTCLGHPRGDDVETLDRIAALTCFRVRFGEWRETPQSEREGGAEADLIVVE